VRGNSRAIFYIYEQPMRDIEITIRVYNQDRHTEERRVHTNQSGENRMNDLREILARIEEQNLQILARLDRLENKPPQKESWSPEELAVALHRKPFTVREWCRLGRILAEKDKYSRLWRVPDNEAQRLLAGGGLQPVLAVAPAVGKQPA